MAEEARRVDIDSPSALREAERIRNELLKVAYSEMESVMSKVSVFACRRVSTGPRGAYGEMDFESFYNKIFDYVWRQKFEGLNVLRFLSMFERRSSGSFSGWFRKSVRRACLEWFRAPVTTSGKRVGVSRGAAAKAESERREIAPALDASLENTQADIEEAGTTAQEGASSHPARAFLEAVRNALDSMRTPSRIALYLYFCSVIDVPDDVLALIASERGVSVEDVKAQVGRMVSRLRAEASKLTSNADLAEVLMTQRDIVQEMEDRLAALYREASAVGVSAEEVSGWEEHARRSSLSAIREVCSLEDDGVRSGLRRRMEESRWRLERAARRIKQIESHLGAGLPKPLYKELASVLGMKESGVTARVLRGLEVLRRILRERGIVVGGAISVGQDGNPLLQQ